MQTWLICGGRTYSDRQSFGTVMAEIVEDRHPDDLHVIHGGAGGADWLAEQWAMQVFGAKTITPYPADWDQHGRAAGPIRNQRMIDEGKPDLVIAFPGGRGTADMVRRARKAGVKVIEVVP